MKNVFMNNVQYGKLVHGVHVQLIVVVVYRLDLFIVLMKRQVLIVLLLLVML
jgi:hypothetical protein